MPISLTLKQKLSNIARSQSAPTAPTSSSNPSSSARRNILNFPRRGDRTEDYSNHAIGEQEFDDLMHKVIRQSGLDFETRPIVVVTAANFPDPRILSYDLLFQRVLRYLDMYVESDYIVVFFVAGGKFAPGWSWVWKSYRSLHRKYRKNLKKLYIVHTTLFSKMLFSLAGTIISPKFFRKIQYIGTLSQLAQCVPLANIDIHPMVYRENLKHENRIVTPGQDAPSQVFGVSLDQLMGEDGLSSGIPRVLKDCADYIRARGLEVEGLFRRSPNSVMLRHAREAYDRGQPVSLASFRDPHVAAVLLKKFFRDMPQPVFPESMYPLIQACPLPSLDPTDRSCIDYIRQSLLPRVEDTSPATLIVLSYALHLLHDVSLRSATNRMDAANLAVCFTPNLVSGSNITRDTQICSIPHSSLATTSTTLPFHDVPGKPGPKKMTLGMIITVCIEQYFEIFEELPDRTNAMFSHPSVSFSSTLPNSAPSADSALYDTAPRRGNTPGGRHLDTPPQRISSSAASTLSVKTTELFTTADGSDSDPDESMLIMPIGPSPTSSSSHGPAFSSSPPSAWASPTSPTTLANTLGDIGIGHPSSPLSNHNHNHRWKDSAAPGSPQSAHESRRGTLRPARSMISIERPANGGTGVSGGSIRVGRGGANGTRRASGSGVEAIGITAAGFFSPLDAQAEATETGTGTGTT